MNDLIKERDVAKITGLSTGTLRIYRCVGKGPSFLRSNNNRVFYDREVVMEWLRNEQRLNEVNV